MNEKVESNPPEILFDLVLPDGRKFWTVREVPVLTALAIYPPTGEEDAYSNKEMMLEVCRLNTERDHDRALAAAMEHGQVDTINPLSYMPNAGAGVWLGDEQRRNQLITLKEITRFAATLGIRVAQQDNHRSLDISQQRESTAERYARVRQAVNDEKKKGTKDFLKVVAGREVSRLTGKPPITVARLKQILAEAKDAATENKWQDLASTPSKPSSKFKNPE